MKIHALSTGTVSIKQSQQRGIGTGMRRRMAIFRSGPFTAELPIHVWAIEHPDGIVLVDAGGSSTARDQRFARFSVTREQELDGVLRAAGIDPGDVRTVVLTHVHGDHIDGLPHVPRAKVLVSEDELRVVRGVEGRILRRVLHQPLPAGWDPTPLRFDGPPLGAFAATPPITPDGRIVAVPTPGHTPGHQSVVVVEDDHHVLLAGDAAYDQAQLLDRHVDGVSPKEDVARATMDTILAHAGRHRTVFLPSHDPGSAARLAAREPIPAGDRVGATA
jgi:glyoxylase-like metal-dependent hydrolase (beta-lactamase superfamily II)